MRLSNSLLRYLALIGVLAGPVSAAPSNDPKLQWVEGWSAVFAGGTHAFHFAVSGDQEPTYDATWHFAVGGRTLARGETVINRGAERAVKPEIRLVLPPVKENVILSGDLIVDLHSRASNKPVASTAKRVWIFAPDPFADRREWLRRLDIHLFDPTNKTATCFTLAGIPFEQVDNLDAAIDINRGMFVVGEGLSFTDYRGLPTIMVQLARRRIDVLCLAPTAGSITLSSNDDRPKIVFQRLCVERQSIISRLDKRLDASDWPDRQQVVLRGVDVTSVSPGSIAEVCDPSGSWPWLDVTYSGPRGRLMICGIGIVSGWQAGPTPRYLLLRILEDIAAGSSPAGDRQEGEIIE